MDSVDVTLFPPILASLVLEGVKWLWRKYVVKNMDFDFKPIFYAVIIPFLTFLATWLLGYIGWLPAIMLDVKGLIQWIVQIVLTLAVYQLGIKPLKEYKKNL